MLLTTSLLKPSCAYDHVAYIGYRFSSQVDRRRLNISQKNLALNRQKGTDELIGSILLSVMVGIMDPCFHLSGTTFLFLCDLWRQRLLAVALAY